MPTPKPKLEADQIQRVRSLRTNATIPERLLWSRLRGKRCGGFKFRRQHAVGPYVLDFFCSSLKLAIEVDGRSHHGRSQPDAERTAYLSQHGIEVIRVHNDTIIEDVDAVASWLLQKCRELEANRGSPSPSPSQREGS